MWRNYFDMVKQLFSAKWETISIWMHPRKLFRSRVELRLFGSMQNPILDLNIGSVKCLSCIGSGIYLDLNSIIGWILLGFDALLILSLCKQFLLLMRWYLSSWYEFNKNKITFRKIYFSRQISFSIRWNKLNWIIWNSF